MHGTSRRQRILEALKARVEAITIANGFHTDLGLKVFLGELPILGPSDPTQALAIIPGEDQVGENLTSNIPIVLPVNFVVMVAAEVEQPWVLVERGLSDVKRAVELEDRSLGGLLIGGRNNPEGFQRGTTELLERRSGSDAIGALITYGCRYAEAWGAPDQ